MEQRERLAHVCGRRRPRTGDGQLPPVDGRRRDLAGIREDEHGAAGRDRLERGRHAAVPREDDRIDRPVRRPSGAPGIRIDREHVVAAALEDEPEEPADEPVADDEHASARNPRHSPEDAGERLDHRPAPVGPVVGELDPSVRTDALGEAARPDRRRRKPLAGRLVPGEATLALPARHVVDERDTTAVLELGDDLVPQHRARVRCVELFDVRPAETAGQNARKGTRPVGLRQVGEDGLPAGIEDDRPHGAYRRSLRTEGEACRSSCTAAPRRGRRCRATRAGASRRRSTTWASSTRSSRRRGRYGAAGQP